MDGLKALETINSWDLLLIEGSSEHIEQMLVDVEKKFGEKGWARDPKEEARMENSARSKNRWHCFVGGPAGGPRLMLGLTRISDRRLRGRMHWLLTGSGMTQMIGVAEVVEDVMKNVLTPTAANLELKVTFPQFGTKSRVPPRTLAALGLFSDLAAGAWPLSTDLEQHWRRFVIRACQEDVAFDLDELSDWFVTNGWSSEDAHALIEKFMSEASLISEYVDAINA